MDLRRCSFAALLVSFLLIFNFSAFAADAPAAMSPAAQGGEKLFKANCTSCHKVTSKMIGPALVGAEKRWTEGAEYNGMSGREWLNHWVKNSSEVIKGGNPYAVKLFESNNKSVMTAFPQFADKDIADLMAYIEYAATAPQPTAANTTGGTAAKPDEGGNNLTLYVLVGLLLAIALGLSKLTSELNHMVMKKQGIPIPVPVPLYKNKKIFVTLGLLAFIGVGYATVIDAVDLGRQQGYSPDQPIKFSHKLHAGINKIDCQYCHSSAAKSKTSGIPSENVCMNCHKGIQEGSVNGKYGRKEITKIYASIGFDPNTLSYIKDYNKMDKEEADKLYTEWLKGDEKHKPTQADIDAVLSHVQKPMEWVKIHNLPDHVSFSHSQHVTIGKVECQTCHGPVQEMDKVYQFAPLSMGWCVNCHRSTEVNFAGNKFYDDYHQLHEDLKNGKIDKVTVETIGGTDCQKCHY